MLRLVFIGTAGRYSRVPLMALARRHRIVGVIESAATPRANRPPTLDRLMRAARQAAGRPGLRDLARSYGAAYMLLDRSSKPHLAEFLEPLQSNLGCIASMNHLLPESALAIPDLGFINLHPSLLPAYRGPNPWFWMFYNMETRGGVTVHHVDAGEDTGDIIAQSEYRIPLGTSPNRLINTAITLGTDLMVQCVDALELRSARRIPQSQLTCVFRARRVKRNEKLIDWSGWPIERCYHVLRGTYPWLEPLPAPHAWPALQWRATSFERRPMQKPAASIAYDWHGPYVSHPEGVVRLRLVISRQGLLESLRRTA